jgi:hypothetical protein
MSHLLQEQNLAERTRGQAPYRDQELLLRHLRQRVLQQAESEGRRKTIYGSNKGHSFIWTSYFFSGSAFFCFSLIRKTLTFNFTWKNIATPSQWILLLKYSIAYF